MASNLEQKCPAGGRKMKKYLKKSYKRWRRRQEKQNIFDELSSDCTNYHNKNQYKGYSD